MLLDASLYVVGDRMQIEIAASEHVNFLKNQMTWRVVERVDGQPWLDKPITLQGAREVVDLPRRQQRSRQADGEEGHQGPGRQVQGTLEGPGQEAEGRRAAAGPRTRDGRR